MLPLRDSARHKIIASFIPSNDLIAALLYAAAACRCSIAAADHFVRDLEEIDELSLSLLSLLYSVIILRNQTPRLWQSIQLWNNGSHTFSFIFESFNFFGSLFVLSREDENKVETKASLMKMNH